MYQPAKAVVTTLVLDNSTAHVAAIIASPIWIVRASLGTEPEEQTHFS